MNKATLITAAVEAAESATEKHCMYEATARGSRRRSVHKSPYKKSLLLTGTLSVKLVRNPTDKTIAAWAEKVLLQKTGISPSRLDEDVISELKKTAEQLRHTTVFSAERFTDFLVDTVKFALNKASEQLEVLRKSLHTAEEKSKLSHKQLTHDQIGQSPLLEQRKQDTQKKNFNTTGLV